MCFPLAPLLVTAGSLGAALSFLSLTGTMADSCPGPILQYQEELERIFFPVTELPKAISFLNQSEPPEPSPSHSNRVILLLPDSPQLAKAFPGPLRDSLEA